MRYLPRLTTLLLVGVVALLLAGGAVGARTLGWPWDTAPLAADAVQDQPGPASAAPLAVPAAAQPAPVASAPSSGGGSTLPGLPGGGATGGGFPALAAEPEGVASAAPAAASPAASAAPITQAAPVAATVGRVALTTDRGVIGMPTETVTITATVTDATGVPLAGVLVSFSLDDGEAGRLGVVEARTDANGLATTTFVPEIFRGTATVIAATEGGASGRVTIAISCGC